MRTSSPDTIESGGFTMMDSSPLSPATTSTSEPKSWPKRDRLQFGVLAVGDRGYPKSFRSE